MKVLINTIPKAGTHLLANFVSQALGQGVYRGGNRFIREVSEAPFRSATIKSALELRMSKAAGVWTAHLFYYPGLMGCLSDIGARVFFLYRDPRAIAVSRAHYMTAHHGHFHSAHLRSCHTMRARICVALKGWGDRERMDADNALDIDGMCRAFLDWRRESDVLALRYEDLLHHGAASMRAVAAHLGVEAPENAGELAEQAAQTKTATFRKGTADGWREDWTEQHAQIFDEVAPSLLEDMGYAR